MNFLDLRASQGHGGWERGFFHRNPRAITENQSESGASKTKISSESCAWPKWEFIPEVFPVDREAYHLVTLILSTTWILDPSEKKRGAIE